MSLLFTEGFDHYDSDTRANRKWDGSSFYPVTNKVRTGIYAARGNGWIYPANADTSTIIYGFALYVTDPGSAPWVRTHFGLPTGYGSMQNTLSVLANGTIELRRGDQSAAVIGASSPSVARTNQWNYIEVKILFSNTVGTVTVKCNGNTVISLTGQDTCYQSTEAWQSFEINTASSNNWVDDIYVCDGAGSVNNDFLGEIRVVTLLPQTDAVGGAGANADFTCSGGTDHGALVDEATPNDDTDYLSSSTPNHVDTWNFPALGYTGTIKGVQLNLWAKKTDVGTRAIAAVARPASTNRVHSATHYLGATDYVDYRSIWELNPEDSAAWEVADIDGAEFGVKVAV